MRRIPCALAFVAAVLGARAASAATLEAEGDVGFAQRSLHHVPIEAVGFHVLLGARTPTVAGGFRFALDAGSTLEGLRVIQGHGGFLLEYIVDRARFGFGGGIGVLSIPRVTGGGALGAFFLEGTLRVAADLAYFGRPRAIDVDSEATAFTRPAVFVAAELALNTATLWGPSLLVGVRY